MLQSAEYFLAGFFGLGWTQNATLEVTIEQLGYNNTLDGYYRCTNANTAVSAGGINGKSLPCFILLMLNYFSHWVVGQYISSKCYATHPRNDLGGSELDGFG